MAHDDPTLHLHASVLTPKVQRGAEVRVRLTLENRGDRLRELASLNNNHEVTNYLVSRPDGAVVATLNNLERQRRLRFQRLSRHGFQPLTLQPGEREVFSENLCPMFPFVEPGDYELRGLYRFGELELVSEPRPLSIRPARVTAHDQQWCLHYGEGYFLHSAWVYLSGGKYHVVLRQSHRFDPLVIDFNPEVFVQDEPLWPRVSFNTTLLGAADAWICWLDRTERLVCLRTEAGEVPGLPEEVASALAVRSIVGPPLLREDRGLVVLLEGRGPDGGDRLEAVALEEDGNQRGRAVLGRAFDGASLMRLVVDEEGRAHLLWLERGDGQEQRVLRAELDLEALALGPEQQLWRTALRPVALLGPTALAGHEAVGCLLQEETEEGGLGVARLPFFGGEVPPELLPVGLPEGASVQRVAGELDNGGTVHLLLLADDGGLYYYNDHRGCTVRVARLGAADLPTPLGLTVTPEGDVFAAFHRSGVGLMEPLIRRAWQDEEGEVDAEERW